jgi:8-oxo-dGTP pyrophosphatase MutT (NUDIX family)
MIDTLRQRLPNYVLREFAQAMPEAAVLMPFTDEPDPHLILTVRSAHMPTHAGEVAFPGGKRDPGDVDLLDTALRESEEEVGLSRKEVEVLAELSPLASRFGMKVTPFVGLVAPDVSLVAEPGEIGEIFRVPLSFFLQTQPELTQKFTFLGRNMRMPSYDFEGRRIWGLTAFMILDVLNHAYDTNISVED